MRFTTISPHCILVLLALTLLPLTALAASGNLMRVTTQSHMQVNDRALPAMTMVAKVCLPANNPDLRNLMGPKQRQTCTISDYRHQVDVTTYHVDCKRGDTTLHGDARYTMTDAGVTGSIHMTGKDSESTMVADDAIHGKRIGACDYQPGAASNYQPENHGVGGLLHSLFKH
jgi:hypothetical protein